jgi:tellurite resistance protein TehA-like permease
MDLFHHDDGDRRYCQCDPCRSVFSTTRVDNVLIIWSIVPFRFSGLETIGTIFFLFNVFLFVLNCTLISLRFYTYPETFKNSFLHPTESLFAPAAVVSFGTILINVSQYGLPNTGPWLDNAVLVLFWIDVALAIIASSGIYLVMYISQFYYGVLGKKLKLHRWSTQTFTISQMTPIWIFPAYPLLIIGPHAGILSADLDPQRALDIIVGGFTVQGIGYLVSLTIYSAFIYRLMTQKLPKESLRPGMFVSVGPSGFTAAGVINMALNAQRAFPADFMGNGPLAAMIVQVVGNWMSLWVWGSVMHQFSTTIANFIQPCNLVLPHLRRSAHQLYWRQ